jgi:hypothetical protein
MVAMTRSATTALLGRKNYEGFAGYWPEVAKDDTAEHRDRAIARWLDKVEKIVSSSTLTEAPWENSRIADGDPVGEVRQLRAQNGGDGVPASSWSLTDTTTADTGAICLICDRTRGDH